MNHVTMIKTIATTFANGLAFSRKNRIYHFKAWNVEVNAPFKSHSFIERNYVAGLCFEFYA